MFIAYQISTWAGKTIARASFPLAPARALIKVARIGVTNLMPLQNGSTRVWGGLAAGMLSLCAGSADTNRIILREDFESFKTTKALRTTWPGGPAELMTNAPGGGRAAAHDGTGMNRRSGFFVFPDATHDLVLEADFYDFGTNTDQNVVVSLNGEDTHDNVAFGLKGAYSYVARVGGFSSKT